ncbi:hypothetical protein WN51_12470 [Melipona quadrifasciata]|uniref:Uncharacterized protein n=1 Tax=Melipona quadrifasciata TaxID=166423 RepID=A0A0M9A3H6_9HYME|nr:hypothetical protein WN51_12470 [Melipona quadrifasciata]
MQKYTSSLLIYSTFRNHAINRRLLSLNVVERASTYVCDARNWMADAKRRMIMVDLYFAKVREIIGAEAVHGPAIESANLDLRAQLQFFLKCKKERKKTEKIIPSYSFFNKTSDPCTDGDRSSTSTTEEKKKKKNEQKSEGTAGLKIIDATNKRLFLSSCFRDFRVSRWANVQRVTENQEHASSIVKSLQHADLKSSQEELLHEVLDRYPNLPLNIISGFTLDGTVERWKLFQRDASTCQWLESLDKGLEERAKVKPSCERLDAITSLGITRGTASRNESRESTGAVLQAVLNFILIALSTLHLGKNFKSSFMSVPDRLQNTFEDTLTKRTVDRRKEKSFTNWPLKQMGISTAYRHTWQRAIKLRQLS